MSRPDSNHQVSAADSGALVESLSLAPTGPGPLAGLKFAVKDLIDVAGHSTGCGNPTWRQDPWAGRGPRRLGRATAGGRCRVRRQDGDRRTGVQPDRRESFLWHAAQSGGSLARAGWIVERIGFGRGLRAGRFRPGHRHRRIGPRAGQQLRPLGTGVPRTIGFRWPA